MHSERGMQRFYVLLEGEITQERTEAEIRRHMAPHTVEFTHIEWLSRFESTSYYANLFSRCSPNEQAVKERVATSFVHPSPQGPLFLAGDAAHVYVLSLQTTCPHELTRLTCSDML